MTKITVKVLSILFSLIYHKKKKKSKVRKKERNLSKRTPWWSMNETIGGWIQISGANVYANNTSKL